MSLILQKPELKFLVFIGGKMYVQTKKNNISLDFLKSKKIEQYY